MDNQISIIDYVFLIGSLVILIDWAKRRQGFTTALRQAPQRHHSLGAKELLCVFLALAVIQFLSAVIVMTLNPGAETDTYCTLVTSQVLTILLLLFIAAKFFDQGLPGFGITTTKPLRTLKFGLIIAFVTTGLTHLTLTATQHICYFLNYTTEQQHESLKILSENSDPTLKYLIIITAAILAPIAEELLFRGILQSFLVKVFTAPQSIFPSLNPTNPSASIRQPATQKQRWQAIALTSAAFTSVHSINNWQHWPALFVLSLCLGYAYEKHRNIIIPIIGHGLFNTLSVTLTLLAAQP